MIARDSVAIGRILRGGVIGAIVLTLCTSAAPNRVRFNRDIRPLLSDRCFLCHGPDANHREADLRLDTEAGATADLGGYNAVVPGEPKRSELVARIIAEEEYERMPPADSGKSLSAAEVELLKRWIEEGAEYESHWSYVEPTRSPAPEVALEAWPRGTVDRFVLARIEAAGLRPSPEADRVTLLRRVSLDLTGLPPSPGDADRFLSDDRPDAYKRLVERLLASPHYGERMAMYWLDLVRYADTVGYHGDQEHPISPYRDWVIRAFNDGMSFDRFTTAQLAGDLLPNATIDQRIASGYNRLLQTTHEGGAQDKEYLAKYAADRVRNFSATWMGATMGCSECHDHKYDPYTQRDFYSLAAFFADLEQQGAYSSPNSSPTNRPPEISVLSPLLRRELAGVDERLQALREQRESAPEDTVAAAIDKETTALEQRRAEIEKSRRRTMVAVSIEPRTVRILPRGDWLDKSGEVVEPAVPAFLGTVGADGTRATRLDLARWLTSGSHPQTARVFVNRLWYLLFGAGLCRTLEDAGSQGEWPTHPELLDWLAVELVDSGWNVKHLVRLIVSSSAYGQSSVPSAALAAADPENRIFARQERWRLPAESVRDTALTVSALLVHQVGGPSARPYQPAGYYSHLNFPRRKYVADRGDDQYRRGVYMHWQRQFLHPMLRAFDAPTREECTARRPESNTPLAALVLLNDPSFVEAARVFAARILTESDATDDRARLDWAWRRALTRAAAPRELAVLERLLESEREAQAAAPDAAATLTSIGLAPAPRDLEPRELAVWTAVARALLNLNETITRN